MACDAIFQVQRVASAWVKYSDKGSPTADDVSKAAAQAVQFADAAANAICARDACPEENKCYASYLRDRPMEVAFEHSDEALGKVRALCSRWYQCMCTVTIKLELPLHGSDETPPPWPKYEDPFPPPTPAPKPPPPAPKPAPPAPKPPPPAAPKPAPAPKPAKAGKAGKVGKAKRR